MAVEKTTMFLNYPDVVSVEQLSEMLDISLKSAYKLLRDNRIEHVKVGRVYKIAKYHVLLYMKVGQSQGV